MSTKLKNTDDLKLQKVLNNLPKVFEKYGELGFPIPSPLAIKNASRLVRDLYNNFAFRYDIYPTMNDEVAIHLKDTIGQSVIFLCNSDGRAQCLIETDDVDEWRDYSDANQLPDKFTRDILIKLTSKQ